MTRTLTVALRVPCVIALLLAFGSGPSAEADLVADWGERFGDPGAPGADFQTVSAVESDSQGNLFIAGEFRGTMESGDTTLSSTNLATYDGFLSKFTPAGQHVWSVTFGGSDNEFVHDLKFCATGGIVVVGVSRSPQLISNGDSIATAGQGDAFLSYYDADGVHQVTEVWGGPGYDRALSVDCVSSGNFIVTGTFWGTVDFGSGPPVTSAGLADFYLLEVLPSGGVTSVATYGGSGDEKWASVCVDDDDDITFAGTFEDTVDFGNGPLVSLGVQDACLVNFAAVGSAATWSKDFGATAGSDAVWATSVATDGDNFFLTGFFSGSASIAKPNLTSAGGFDMFVGVFKSNGSSVWSVRGGSTGGDYGNHITYYDGQLAVTGLYGGNADFGSFNLQAVGSFDAVMFVTDLAGNVTLAKSGGGLTYDSARQSVMNAAGVTVCGDFSGSADFDSLQLTTWTSTEADGYVVRYSDLTATDVMGTVLPAGVALHLGAPTPNPARGATRIEYRSSVASGVLSAEVFDIAGRRVRTLRAGSAGSARTGVLQWDGRGDRGARVPAGVYFVRATDGVSTTQRRVTVVR